MPAWTPERQREAMRRWREANPEKQKAATDRWLARHPGYHTNKSRAYREANPEKLRAQRAVRYAVRVGKILKPTTCESCARHVRLHGHHEDYSKALDVKWLCCRCHRRLHAQ